jgi:hypothetical protein
MINLQKDVHAVILILLRELLSCNINIVCGYFITVQFIILNKKFTIEEDRMVIFSETFVEHPDYKIDQISNDVALVKLPKKIVYTGRTIVIFVILFYYIT